MKKKIILTITMIGLLLTSIACAAANAEEKVNEMNVTVTIDELMNNNHILKQVEIAADGILTITLGSNPTTGFNWDEQAQISNEDILNQTNHEYYAPATDVPGTAGNEEWTFKALKTGETTVNMEYSRPWEGGEKGEWTFNLTVKVK